MSTAKSLRASCRLEHGDRIRVSPEGQTPEVFITKLRMPFRKWLRKYPHLVTACGSAAIKKKFLGRPA